MKHLAVAAALGLSSFGCGGERINPYAPLEARLSWGCPLGGCRDEGRDGAAEGGPRVTCGKPDCAEEAATTCDKASAQVCTKKAMDSWQGSGASAFVVALFERACSFGDLEGCHYAGRVYLGGKGVRKDAARGTQLLERACDAGYARSCEAAAMYWSKRDDPTDLATRFTLAAECLHGQYTSCFRLGAWFERKKHDLARAVALYAKACDGDEGGGCVELGNAYYYGDGVAVDMAKAAQLYTKACSAQNEAGCANMGFLHEYGDGVARDATKAQTFYTGACSAGNAYGCIHVAMLDDYKKGTPRDPAQAAARWRQGCDAAKAKACSFLAMLHVDGKGVARDREKARVLFDKACRAGDHPSCDYLRSHKDD